MGAADVVPGVSGGTIAFITGIYSELLGSIKSFDGEALRLLFTGKFRRLWHKVNGAFLFSLLLGIAISVFSLARVMKWLLENEPIATWSFFFGLIVASALLVSRQVGRWRAASVAALVTGVAVGYVITALSPTSTPDTWWFVMLSGAIAVCAMILPGISGSFILLLLGKYYFVMTALSEMNVVVLVLFAVGAAAGIISFSHALSWLLKHYHDVVVALLMGFMLGSLNKVWPWKRVLETYTDSHGAAHPLIEANVSPTVYSGDAQLVTAISCCLAGFLLIFVVEYTGKAIARKRG